MSSRGGNSNIGVGVRSIPTGSRKMVQNLKEIVNYPETEIYSMLKDCNMDPNEAVNRLLSQDPFHEVKSKRDKKKESRENIELKPRAANRHSGYGGLTQSSFSESGGLHGKLASKKENGVNIHTSASPVPSVRPSNNLTQRSSVPSENKVTTQVALDGNWSSSQSVSGFQPVSSGPVSLADIVKMGRPPNKSSNSVQYINQNHVWASCAGVLDQNIISSKDPAPKLSDPEPGVGMGQHLPVDDDWPVDEQPPTAPDLHVDRSNFSTSSLNQHQLSQADKTAWFTEGPSIENTTMSRSESASSRKIQDDNAGSRSDFNNELHSDAFEHQEAEEVVSQVSEVVTNVQHLSVQEDQGLQHEKEHPPSVIIPDHLQVQTAECLHLSFGSFGPGNSVLPGSYSSRPSKSSLNESSADPDVPFVGHSDSRDELQRIPSDGNIDHEHDASAGNYESPSVSQLEVLNNESGDVSRNSQYTFQSVTSNYNYEHSQLLNAALPHPQISSQLHNLPPFSSIMKQAHTNTLPSSLHASNVQPSRDSEHPYSPFPVTQSMPANYGNHLTSISGVMSLPEALKTVSSSQQGQATTHENLSGNSTAAGSAVPQHVAMHPYSQPSLPLGPYAANMISYPFLPQSYTYLPSAFQQPFAGNNAYHQSLAAALLPQYKNSVSVSSLPQSATIASGYGGGFGSSATIPSNFPINQQPAQRPATIGYEDLLSSQYRDGNNLLISLQQNDNSAMGLHGLTSRTAVPPPNAFYSFQGQGHGQQQQQQQSSGLRQIQQQQPSQSGYGHQNHYYSQGSMPTEHQPQNPRDVLAGGAHGQGSQQQSSNPNQQPMWQNGY